MGAVDQIIFLSRSTTTLSNSKTTMLSSLETLPHHILTTVLECVDVFTLYRLERTSKTLRDVVEFNGYLKYVTSSGERLINPLISTGEYSVHHAWDFSDLWTCPAGVPKLFRFEPPSKFLKEWLMEECNMFEKPAVYPFLDKLTIELPQFEKHGEIDVSGKSGGPVTFKDVLDALIREVAPACCCSTFEWKDGTTFQANFY